MKILWIKTDFLHPTTRGGQIRTLETLRELHRDHEIHYVGYETPGQPEGPARAQEYCTRSYSLPHDVPPKTSPRFAVQLVQGLFSPLPVAVSRYRTAIMRETVDRLLRQIRFDSVVCDFLFPAPNVADLSRAVLFQHNVETMIWRRHVANASDPIRRWYLQQQADRMFHYERQVCRQAGFVVAVSEKDESVMRSEFGIDHVANVPTGVDVVHFTAPAGATTIPFDLVFVGSMDWMANIDGAQWFFDHVLPRIRQQRPDCRIALVGRDPAPKLRERAAATGVTVTGTVPDVRPYLWGAVASIVPLRIGGGTRLKIFEAMAAGCPVVSTTIGAEGLPVDHGTHLWIADEPEDFAHGCIQLLTDADRRRSLATVARQLVTDRFSWTASARLFAEFLDQGPRP
jgi:glycosyltransferase involved in cell wall biosynthesis